jgi:hypothetical integral membrane protein (TIGR02206 family)
MSQYFLAEGNQPFTLFSLTHWVTLGILMLAIVSIFLLRKWLKNNEGINRLCRVAMAVILIVSEISLHWWLWSIGAWTIQYSLPLHLSSLSIILSAVLLVTKSYSLFEFTYFAGVGSAIQAMLTPDISSYTFPHFRYVHFFISHGGIVLANVFMIFVEKYEPTLKSLWKAFLYLNLYTVFIFILNDFLKGNYMYISEKPINPSILDYLGPWPFYILPLEVLALTTFGLLYLPFLIGLLVKKGRK